MKKLYFQNPEFRYDEINVTVRLGRKWATGLSTAPAIDEVVQLTEAGTERSYGPAIWRGSLLLTMAELMTARSVLELEHDPDCQNIAGLVAELCSVYGLGYMLSDQMLTVCFFKPVGTQSDTAA